MTQIKSIITESSLDNEPNLAASKLLMLLFALTKLIHASDSIILRDHVNFVLTNKQKEYIFPLPLNATLGALHTKVAMKCNIQTPFEIRLSGKTIVSTLSDETVNNQSIAENPCIMSALRILADIWKESASFKIPLKIHPIRSDGDYAVFMSLLSIFGGPDSNVHEFEWFWFIKHCVETGTCSVHDLCDRFNTSFHCHGGELTEIRFNQHKLRGFINLGFLPPTVERLNIERNLLTEIIGIDQLTGKKLQVIKMRGNPAEINLEYLVRSPLSEGNPLRSLWVTVYQICASLPDTHQYQHLGHCLFGEKVHEAAKNWIDSSILKYLMVGRSRPVRHQDNNGSHLFDYDRRTVSRVSRKKVIRYLGFGEDFEHFDISAPPAWRRHKFQ